jgi:sodium pump decarboxylase gamma subunit
MFWERIIEGFLILIVGMGGVLLTLFIYYLIMEAINKGEKFLIEYQKQKAERAKLAASKSSGCEMDDELITVITAAISTAIEKKVIVRKIRFIKSQPVSPWSAIGRMNLISSHNIQKHQ